VSATENVPTLVNFKLQLVQNHVMMTCLDVFPLAFLKTTVSNPCIGIQSDYGSQIINGLIEIENKALYHVRGNFTDYNRYRHGV